MMKAHKKVSTFWERVLNTTASASGADCRQPSLGAFLLARVGVVLSISLSALASEAGILEIRDGYFWDPEIEAFVVPRGIAYQVWNPPVGADQSLEQVEYDLKQFKAMHANSVRAEFVWSQVEPQNNQFDFSKPDFLVEKAEALGLRLFIIIGFQYPPDWFNPDWYAINDRGGRSDVLNYVHPKARETYVDYIRTVVARFRDSPAIGGWILGNEYAFFDLWEDLNKYPNHRFLGYDPLALEDFRRYLREEVYHDEIEALNAHWDTDYRGFDAVKMPRGFPPERDIPGFHDLIQWRKRTIGDFVAIGAAAAREADPNHLQTYSMVGGIFDGKDAVNTAEDGKTIVDRCRAAGAPLDFWSINNYAWAELGHEMRTADFGIGKYQAQTGLPVMISETGHSDTETNFEGAQVRQPLAVPSQIWESLISGAIGTHIFTWNDRERFTRGFFLRERGFGMVDAKRLPKPNGVFDRVRAMFLKMADLDVAALLGGSRNPPPDIQIYWSVQADMGWPTANVENALLWGALKRLGYQPGILDDEQFKRGDYKRAPVLLLSRAFRMAPEDLAAIRDKVIPAGINVHATFDLPGRFNAYHKPNPEWKNIMSSVFGLDVRAASAGWNSGETNLIHAPVRFQGRRTLGGISSRYRDVIKSLKIWHGIRARSGITVVTHTGLDGTQPPMPALQVKDLGSARSAISTFAFGDVAATEIQDKIHRWDFHTTWLDAIYRGYFGIEPKIQLAGPGADYIFRDYRICRNGTVLVSLLNGHTRGTSVEVNAPELLAGLTVEDLTSGGVIERDSDGSVRVSIEGDQCVLLYAYQDEGGDRRSLVNPSPDKLWFRNAPPRVWPRHQGFELDLGYDLVQPGLALRVSLEQIRPRNKVLSLAEALPVTGRGDSTMRLQVPDADLNDPLLLSSTDGGSFLWRAVLERKGQVESETTLPVNLTWGARPAALPAQVSAGTRNDVTVDWEALPSFLDGEQGAPADRTLLWDSVNRANQHYNVVVELRSGGAAVARDEYLTGKGSGKHTFSLPLPAEAAGPFDWTVFVEGVPEVASVDVNDGFEGRPRGAESPRPFEPWIVEVETQDPLQTKTLDLGTVVESLPHSQAAFLEVQNGPAAGDLDRFGISRVFQRPIQVLEDETFSNQVFRFDFRERNRREAILEVQLTDGGEKRIRFRKPYRPGPDGWDTIEATLGQLEPATNQDGDFDFARVGKISAWVVMRESQRVYEGFIDNLVFSANQTAEDFEKFKQGLLSEREPAPSRISPWHSFHDSQFHNTLWLDEGVGLGGSEGSQSAFLVIQDPPDPGSFAVFGLAYTFPEPWALPESQRDWNRYSFRCDFREHNGMPCNIELQLKNQSDPAGNLFLINHVEPYRPDPATRGWQTVRATLDRFRRPDFAAGFDPARVQALIVNIQMLQPGSIYVGFFDDIRFDGPDEILAHGERLAFYESANDTFGIQRIELSEDGQVVLHWIGNGMLQSAEQITGPWLDEPAAAATPYRVNAEGARRFFRLRLP